MNEKNKVIGEFIESLSVQVCMLEQGSIPGMGKLLNSLSELGKHTSDIDNIPFSDVVESLQHYLGRLILNEVFDVKPLEKGISALQSIWRDVSTGKEFGLDITKVIDSLGLSTGVSGHNEETVEEIKLSEEDIQIFNEFIFESRENLETIERKLIELEDNPDNKSGIDSIFRTIHTIKGVSGAIELPEINTLCHHMENLIESARAGSLRINGERADIILESVDTLKLMIEEVEKSLKKKVAGCFKSFDISGLIEKIRAADTAEDTVPSTAACEDLKDNHIVIEENKFSPKQATLSKEDTEILGDFIVESRENLETIELKLIELEDNPDDKEIINAIFRPFHTIKGVSGFLELKKINTICHHTENFIDGVRSGILRINDEIADIILEAVDTVKMMLEECEKNLETGTVSFFDDIDILKLIEKITTIVASDGKEKSIGKILIETGAINEKDLRDSLRLQKSNPEKKLGEILVREKRIDPKEVKNALKIQKSRTPSTSLQVKVDTEKLDNLVDLAGELVIAQSIFKKIGLEMAGNNQKYFQHLSQVTQAVSGIQKIAMSMRMVPVKNTFQKMIRLVRDLARNSGKECDLIMSGEETEVDRNVVDELYEPMVHMIRNSVDHGLETPSEREKAGKNPKGSIHLRAFQKGGNIVIVIEDDGKGLDKNIIFEKAIERGLAQKNDVFSDKEIYGFIMQPGFSTAKEITDISGRGVGMDVVKKAIEKLRGRLDIDATMGKGSVFTISLPLTMAIVDGMLVRTGTEKYIIPTHTIIESFKPDRKNCHTVKEKGEMVRHRERLIPLVRFDRIFNTKSNAVNPWDGIVVVVENDGECKALLLDELLGKEEFVIKNLGETFNHVKGLAGSAILADGRVGLILDMSGLFQAADLNG